VLFDREMPEKRLDLGCSHFARVALAMEDDEAPDPLDILCLGSYAVVTQADPGAYLVEQPRLRGGIPGCISGSQRCVWRRGRVFMSGKSFTISEMHGHTSSIHQPPPDIAPAKPPAEDAVYTRIGVH